MGHALFDASPANMFRGYAVRQSKPVVAGFSLLQSGRLKPATTGKTAPTAYVLSCY
jgi:hypothetical protein